MKRIIGIGDYTISNSEEDLLITHALGSCVAVIFYNKELKHAAMIHIALPHRPIDQGAHHKIGYYANSGLECIISELQNISHTLITNYKVEVIGGADSIKLNDFFQIGKRNLTEVYNILNDRNIKFSAVEVGGNVSRTVKIRVSDGNIEIVKQPLFI